MRSCPSCRRWPSRSRSRPSPSPSPSREPEPDPEPELVAERTEPKPVAEQPEPVAERTEPIAAPRSATPRRGFLGWLFRSRTSPAVSEATPAEDAVDESPVEDAPAEEAVEESLVEDAPAAQTLEWPRVEDPVAEEPVAEAEPVVAEPVVAEAEPVVAVAAAETDAVAPLNPDRARVILDEALDALGAAHHRPFSRG